MNLFRCYSGFSGKKKKSSFFPGGTSGQMLIKGVVGKKVMVVYSFQILKLRGETNRMVEK